MVTKTDFTEQEWAAVVDAPQMAGIAVMVAGASGVIGSIKEAAAAAGSVFAGTTHASELIRLISGKEEMQAAQSRIRAAMGEFGDKDPNVWVHEQTVATLQRAGLIMKAKAPTDFDTYREWILSIADKVANAAKEGGFLGFGGERVSEGEVKMIAAIKSALA
jgi:hypothetical protein